jgi:hypothetical protein
MATFRKETVMIKFIRNRRHVHDGIVTWAMDREVDGKLYRQCVSVWCFEYANHPQAAALRIRQARRHLRLALQRHEEITAYYEDRRRYS